ncbi:MAG: WhiB family transcriptional regulator [Actinomycetota bacterium]
MTWRDFALCKGTSTELFFPHRGDTRGRAQALIVCGDCPVQQPCRDHAIPNEEFGIWGGMTEQRRRRIRTGHTPLEVAS